MVKACTVFASTGEQGRVSAGNRTLIQVRFLYMVRAACSDDFDCKKKVQTVNCSDSSGGQYSGVPYFAGKYLPAVCYADDVYGARAGRAFILSE